MIPVRKTDLVHEAGLEATLISCHQGICKAVKLNHTGYKVWQLIDDRRTIWQIADLLLTSCDSASQLDQEAICRDVGDFAAALEKEGFLDLEPDVPGEPHYERPS